MEKLLKSLSEKDVINVRSFEEDVAFRTLLDKEGYKTFEGESYLDKDKYFDKYGKKLCYAPNKKMYTNLKFALKNGYTVHPLTDFIEPSTSTQLKHTIKFFNDLERSNSKNK
jgi:hypothetical protein